MLQWLSYLISAIASCSWRLDRCSSWFEVSFSLILSSLQYSYEYRTKLGMTKVVLRGSWGYHHCKTHRGPPKTIPKTIPWRRFAQGAATAKPIGAHPTFRMSLCHVPNFVRNSYALIPWIFTLIVKHSICLHGIHWTSTSISWSCPAWLRMVQNAQLGSTPAGPFALELSDQGLLALAHRHLAVQGGQFDQLNVSDLISTLHSPKASNRLKHTWLLCFRSDLRRISSDSRAHG